MSAAIDLWPCDRCGAPGVRNVGTRGYCWSHSGELFARFTTFTGMPGIGLPTGVADAPGVGRVRCSACEATWIGAPGESCDWCRRHVERLQRHEAEMVLTPPDGPDEAAMVSWAQRMHTAVSVGLVTIEQARHAYDKAVRHAA
ncbi:MAG: hypothetical protein WCP59_18060 [Actinomycetota bacterium]|jgi:predicted amidophosphoribosyltransferase